MKRRETEEFWSERHADAARTFLETPSFPEQLLGVEFQRQVSGVPTQKFARTFAWDPNVWRTAAGNQAEDGRMRKEEAGEGERAEGMGAELQRGIHLCQEVLAT